MKPFLFFLTIVFAVTNTSAQTYSIPAIPKELIEGADAVIMREETDITVEKLNKVISKKHLVVAIFNKAGEENFGSYSKGYNKFSKIKKLEAAAYSYGGSLIVKSKSSDVQDVAENPFDNSVTDIRVKQVSLEKKNLGFPYILEFVMEEEKTQTFFYEDWIPQPYAGTGIMLSRHILRTADNVKYRTRELNMENRSRKYKENGYNVESWEISNLIPLTADKYRLPNSFSAVFIEPANYQIDKYEGEIANWTDLGNFYKNLNKGRDQLPGSIIFKLKEAIGTETDPKLRAKKVYEFMQSQTRYFNLSFALGGWQSLPASLVAEKGYGDCKALTNYTISLLKEAGIKAYPALINSGNTVYSELDDFPRNAFNHIIACIPLPRDTVWLECTNQSNPFGYLGSFTGNRKALLIKENQAELVQTRSYRPEENYLKSKVNLKLLENGSGKFDVESDYGGIQHESIHFLASGKNTDKQKESLKRKIRASDLDIQRLEYQVHNDGERFIREKSEFIVPGLGSVSGDRLFFTPNVVTGFFAVTEDKSEKRKEAFYLDPNYFSIHDTDSVWISIPEGYKVENKPRNLRIDEAFGSFELTLSEIAEGKVLYVRNAIVKGGTYPQEIYPEWLRFKESINRSDRQRIVLRRE